MARLENGGETSPANISAVSPVGGGTRGSAGGHVTTLAPILETDDIMIDGGDAQQPSSTSLPAVTPTDQVDPADSGSPGVAGSPPPRARASLILTTLETTLETTRHALERHAPRRVSWHDVAYAISSIGNSHAKTPPETIDAMKWRERIHFYLTQPEDSQLGWVIHHGVLLFLILNVAVMAAETLDGPRFQSSDPGYPYLPEDSFFLNVEHAFTAIYLMAFCVRVGTAKSQKAFWKSKLTWIEFIAWTPAFIYQAMYQMNKNEPDFNALQLRGTINYLRLARLFRIIASTRVYVGSKVMFKAIKDSIAPLKICFFFLITVVMVFATAIFYAEPCYDLKTCTFTDIFNAGYFVMVTVATVGYGSQVPSLFNGGSLLLTCIVMIFGSLYLAMPLAIVGIRYDAAWRDFERTKSSKSRDLQSYRSGAGGGLLTASNAAKLAASLSLSASSPSASPSKDSTMTTPQRHALAAAAMRIDDTLQQLESRKVYTLSYVICDRFYEIATKMGEINTLVVTLFTDPSLVLSSSNSSSPPLLPSPSSFRIVSSSTMASPPSPSARTGSFPLPGDDATAAASSFTISKTLSSEVAQISKIKARNEMTVKILENIMNLLKGHKKICTEIRGLVLTNNNDNGTLKIAGVSIKQGRTSSASQSMSLREGSFSKTATGVFGRARRALSSASKTRSLRFMHMGPPTWKSKIWEILEHSDVSKRAKRINKVRLYLVLLSIALFYAQTTPELQATGVMTPLCSRSVDDFCQTTKKGYFDQPGCFELDANGHATVNKIDFHCEKNALKPHCYGQGFNFGSSIFASTCTQVFGKKGALRICNNRLCKPPLSLLADMESKWVFLEFFFGILFTAEMILRIVVHPNKKKIYGDLTLWLDLTALFPFYVEVGEILSGTMPVYSVVPTAPSFFAVIRVLKTFRVLKLGTHISGSEVLARTALLVFKRLMIPVFFLFIGSVMCGAVFYELERGTECFVGQSCTYWGKELLTPSLTNKFPLGKRLMVQNTNQALILDMLRSTWFALVTITTVGYGDMRPRTALGRFFDILTMIMSACYTAMPLTLVGGQFYVCYEMYLIDKRRKAKAVEPKPHFGDPVVTSGGGLSNSSNGGVEPPLMSLAGFTQDPVIPGLNAPIVPPSVDSAGSATTPPEASCSSSSRKHATTTPEEDKEPRKPTISQVELQILSQFILIHKVLNVVIEDLSQLNRLGSQRVAGSKKEPAISKNDENGVPSSTSASSSLAAEMEIEAKIHENMVFCVTVFLNFAPVIEKIVGVRDRQPASHGVGPCTANTDMPSILHEMDPNNTSGGSPKKEKR